MTGQEKGDFLIQMTA